MTNIKVAKELLRLAKEILADGYSIGSKPDLEKLTLESQEKKIDGNRVYREFNMVLMDFLQKTPILNRRTLNAFELETTGMTTSVRQLRNAIMNSESLLKNKEFPNGKEGWFKHDLQEVKDNWELVLSAVEGYLEILKSWLPALELVHQQSKG